LADFFSDDEVFIAYGLEKYSHEDLDLDSEGIPINYMLVH
jgi:hypothetical protein